MGQTAVPFIIPTAEALTDGTEDDVDYVRFGKVKLGAQSKRIIYQCKLLDSLKWLTLLQIERGHVGQRVVGLSVHFSSRHNYYRQGST